MGTYKKSRFQSVQGNYICSVSQLEAEELQPLFQDQIRALVERSQWRNRRILPHEKQTWQLTKLTKEVLAEKERCDVAEEQLIKSSGETEKMEPCLGTLREW